MACSLLCSHIAISLLVEAPWSVFSNGGWDLGITAWDDIENGQHLIFPQDVVIYCSFHKKLTVIFALEFAWYLHGIVETVVCDRNRGDFLMMVAHHFLAAALIYMCVVESAHRVGLYILGVLDFADIVLYSAKMFHVSTSDLAGKALNSRYQKGQTMALLTVATAWTVSRMLMFSYIVQEMYRTRIQLWACTFMRLAITLLLVMQWVWGILCWRMVLSQLTQGFFVDAIHNSVPKKSKKQ